MFKFFLLLKVRNYRFLAYFSKFFYHFHLFGYSVSLILKKKYNIFLKIIHFKVYLMLNYYNFLLNRMVTIDILSKINTLYFRFEYHLALH